MSGKREAWMSGARSLMGCGFLVMSCFLMPTVSAYAEDSIERVSLPLIADMQRADLYAWKTSYHPEAVLVLSPGVNGSGEGLIRQRAWMEFARKHKLGLVGLSFASEVSLLQNQRGYYYASQGSGQLLLDGLRKIYGKDLPLLLYGFSGGAHFTSRFEEWAPGRVIAWCAYSAGWWSPPSRNKDETEGSEKNPPGIVACGDQDPRYGTSLFYFKQGRALGKPWLWISLAGVGHQGSPALEDFVRDYFSEILHGNKGHGDWVDVDLKTKVTPSEVKQYPSITGWLPDGRLLEHWKKIHEP